MRPLSAGLAVAALAGLPLLLVLSDGLSRASLVAGALAIGSLALARLTHDRRWWMTAPTWFVIPWFVIFAARPYYDDAVGDADYWQGLLIGATYPESVYVACCGLIFFQVGYYLLRPNDRPAPSASTRDPGARPLLRAVWAWYVLVLCLVAVFLAQNDGLATLGAFFSGRTAETQSAYATSSGYLYTAPLWLVPVSLYCLVRSRKERAYRRSFRRAGLVLLASSMILSVGVGDRSYFIPALLAMILVSYLTTGRRPNWVVALLLLPPVLFFGVLVPRVWRSGEAEAARMNAVEYAWGKAQNPGAALFGSDDTSMARGLALTIAGVPDVLPYQYGKTYLAVPARPIPRQFFPNGKPISGDELLGLSLQKNRTGIEAGFSYSIFAEPYLSGGIPGVAIFSFVFGAIWRVGWVAFVRRDDRIVAQVMWAVSLPLMMVWVRGGVNVDFQRQLFYTVPLLLVLGLARVQSGDRLRG